MEIFQLSSDTDVQLHNKIFLNLRLSIKRESANILEMEWPSKNIRHGGILHPHKVSYSPQTHDMLKGTVFYRKIFNYFNLIKILVCYIHRFKATPRHLESFKMLPNNK